MYAPGICKPHSATTPLHLPASDIPALHRGCYWVPLFRRFLDVQNSIVKAASNPDPFWFWRPIHFILFLIFGFSFESGLNPVALTSLWAVYFKRVCELSPFNKQVLGWGGRHIVQWQEQLPCIHGAHYHSFPLKISMSAQYCFVVATWKTDRQTNLRNLEASQCRWHS